MAEVPSGRRKRRQRKGRRGKSWRWLGLGALGLGAAATVLLRRRPEEGGRSGRRRLPRTEEANDLHGRRLELAPDLDLSWLSAAGGSLRVAERPAPGGAASLNVLFLHGLGGRLEQWAPQLGEEVDHVRSLALDLPGHGESDPWRPEDFSLAGLVQALDSICEDLDLRRVVLVGHSFGAAVATAYAGAHPDRVEGLLLVDPNGDPTLLPRDQRRSFLDAVRRDPHGELGDYFRQILIGAPPEVADHVLAALRSVSARLLARGVEISMEYSPLDDLKAFTGPCHAIYSEFNDVPHSLHRVFPELSASWIPGVSHWLMMEAPDAFAETLEPFLNQVLAARVSA